VGVGKAWQLPSCYKNWYGIELIGPDIDGSEMKNNDTLDQKIVYDVVAGIPLADGQIDLIWSIRESNILPITSTFFGTLFAFCGPAASCWRNFPDGSRLSRWLTGCCPIVWRSTSCGWQWGYGRAGIPRILRPN
jgi:hypothetical protein